MSFGIHMAKKGQAPYLMTQVLAQKQSQDYPEDMENSFWKLQDPSLWLTIMAQPSQQRR